MIPVTALQSLLQNLVSDGVSIRDSRTIMETLASRAGKTQNLEDLTETVRAALGRNIVDRLFEGSDTLYVMSLDAAAENRLLQEMGEEGEAADFSRPAGVVGHGRGAGRCSTNGGGISSGVVGVPAPAADAVLVFCAAPCRVFR